MSELIAKSPEYVYMTIPAEYVCVYHRILAMLADYGEEMLKDCKATCKDRNSGVIECFNMFNAAVAARKLGKESLANALITYIKAKINQIYGGVDNSTSFVFPVDENGQIKAFVSCGERPIFEIAPDTGDLYEHKFGNGFVEHFYLGEEDEPDSIPTDVQFYADASVEVVDGVAHPCLEITYRRVNAKSTAKLPATAIYQRYVDHVPVTNFEDVIFETSGMHSISVVVNYDSKYYLINTQVYYEFN